MNKNDNVILLVDDSPTILELLNRTLEHSGYDVLLALEGKQALAIVDNIQPNMILLDAMMPNMDGFETCRKLKSIPELTTVPIIFMTGLNDTDNVVKGLEMGAVDYLTKPFDLQELLARIKVHLNNARHTSSVYSALDSVGQFLFTVNNHGDIIWATPQTHALYAKASINDDIYNNIMAPQLQSWIAHKPRPNDMLNFTDLNYSLTVSFIRSLPGDGQLLKLIDKQEIAKEKVLSDKLKLTTRESQVLLWISNGKTNSEIAQILEMSPRTVNKHLEHIFPKLGVENRTAAARMAMRAFSEAV